MSVTFIDPSPLPNNQIFFQCSHGLKHKKKAQSSQWKLPNEPTLKNKRPVRSNVEVILMAVVNFCNFIFHEFLPQDTTVS